MDNLAIIPARGGSKRIPKKNIKLFLGEPIISYSIKTAIDSNLFDDIIVSTDDLEIAKIAKDYGAQVPFFRSEKNSSDYATTYDVIEEVINELKTKKKIYKNICCIYPCAPLIKKEYLIDGLDIMKLNDYDTVISLVRYSTKIQRAFKLHDNRIEMFDPQFQNSRSQDLEDAFYDPGQFYWAKIDQLLKSGKLFTSNTGSLILDEMSAQDIDNEIDWKLAEIKYSLLK